MRKHKILNLEPYIMQTVKVLQDCKYQKILFPNYLDPSQAQDDRFLKSVIKLLTYLLIELNLINSIKKIRLINGSDGISYEFLIESF